MRGGNGNSSNFDRLEALCTVSAMLIEQQRKSAEPSPRSKLSWNEKSERENSETPKKSNMYANHEFDGQPVREALESQFLSYNSASDGSQLNSICMNSISASDAEGSVSSCGKASFIVKLCEMLNAEASDGLVRWGVEGRSIVITDPAGFSQYMLPRYFKHRNFPSFVRQLNLYGFRKTSQEPSRYEYQHELFVRGREHNMKDIKRRVRYAPVPCLLGASCAEGFPGD